MRSVRAAFFAALTAMTALLSGSPAAAQQADGGAEAVIVRSLTFIKDEDLDFGAMLAGATAGTVVVPPTGARTRTGGVTLVGSAFQPARFAGRGTQNQNVQISINSNSVVLTRVSGTQTMIADTFIIGSTPTAPLTTNPRVFRITAATGVFNFPVGATLRVGANQVPGTYRGTFTLTLNYQ
jgi:hypothetical protein